MNDTIFTRYGNSEFALYQADITTGQSRSLLFLRALNDSPPDTVSLTTALSTGLIIVVDQELSAPNPLNASTEAASAYQAIQNATLMQTSKVPDNLSSGIGFLRWPSLTVVNNAEWLGLVNTSTSGAIVSETCFIRLSQSYYLGLATGGAVTLSGNALTFQNLSLRAPTVWFCDEKLNPLGTLGQSIELDTLTDSLVSLDLGANATGCLTFQLTLVKDIGRNVRPDHQRFGLCLRYFTNANTNLTPFSYPVFNTETDALSLQLTIDPLNILDHSRSFATLLTDTASSYISNRGGGLLSLTPTDSHPIIFSASPTSTTPTGNLADGPVYAHPNGKFIISGLPDSQGLDLLCGLSGIEVLQINNGNGGSLTFVSDKAAVGNTSNATLTSEATTAWLALEPAMKTDIVFYDIQPKVAKLYTLGAKGIPWPLCETSLTSWTPAAIDAAQACWPIVPYRGLNYRTGTAIAPTEAEVSTWTGAFKNFETKVLQPFRRANLPAPSPAGEDTVALWTIAPSGLLVGLNNLKDRWVSLILAAGTNDSLFLLSNIPKSLHLALQVPAPLVVFTEQAFTPATGLTIEKGNFELAGLTYDLGYNPASPSSSAWVERGTITAVKYCEGCLRDLLTSSATWGWTEGSGMDQTTATNTLMSLAAELTGDAQTKVEDFISQLDAKTSTINTICVIKGIFAHADALRSGNPDYQALVDIIDNENWQGTIILRARVSMESFPPELALLGAGISANTLDVNYVAISLTQAVSQTIPEGGGKPILKLANSTFTGLLSYSNKIPLSPVGPYAYQIEVLQMSFANGVVSSYSSKVKLRLSNLFGSTVSLENGASDILSFSGAAQRHNGKLNVRLTTKQPITLTLNGSVICSITINEASFFEVKSPNTITDPSAIVQSRFAFVGNLKTLNATSVTGQSTTYDFFSYDSLAFQSLYLNLSFAWNKRHQPNFVLSPVNSLVFSPGVPRSASLAAELPLRVSGMIDSSSGASFKSLSYDAVEIDPAPLITMLGKDWLAMIYDLQLGTLGVLSKSAPFSIQVAVAWTPGSDVTSMPIWVGVKVPHMSSDGSIFTLEGVLKVGLQAIKLYRPTDAGAACLLFENLGITVFGQTIPPGADINIGLFGNPQNRNQGIAWLGEYKKGE